LLAQILPAASFPDEISQAQTPLNSQVDEGLIESQPWAISVKALAHYPQILQMMAENPDWTIAVGQAYVTQKAAVERSIQRLRRQAEQAGILQSNPGQVVTVEPNYITFRNTIREFIGVLPRQLSVTDRAYKGRGEWFSRIAVGQQAHQARVVHLGAIDLTTRAN
jgi:hypothetical protein